MARPLNYFEKAFIAQQNPFFTTCEMAARSKARFLLGVADNHAFFNGGIDPVKVKAFALDVITNGVGDQREFAKNFLQYHTGEVDQNAFGVNESINAQLLAQDWAATDGQFDIFMDDVFKAKG